MDSICLNVISPNQAISVSHILQKDKREKLDNSTKGTQNEIVYKLKRILN